MLRRFVEKNLRKKLNLISKNAPKFRKIKYVSTDMEAFEEIKDIVETVLGEPRRDFPGSGGWYEYNCPNCAHN